ncbi:MAG: heavy-metal-associated domain-containing protein [Candidatus Sericytochromatia bacterium]|nr:heavy-metal-associated domain-containing protein [Candidatus Tanganyikabacteria bacterium]
MKKLALLLVAGALMGAANPKLKTEKFEITGMTCTSCVEKVTQSVSKRAGVRTVNVDLESGVGTITYEAGKVDAARIIASIKEAGFKAKAKAKAAKAT